MPGKFYFTPIVTYGATIVTGYMSKIEPTPAEIEVEKKRIRTIIEEGIRKEYGGWANYRQAMKKAGEETAAHERKEAPRWVRRLMPPSLVERAVPLLMEGALRFAMAHPELQSTPIGNVGETGLLILDDAANVRSVPLGLDAPVADIDISPDGRLAAAIIDMSYEDAAGTAHTVGKISLIELPSGKILHESIFANALDEVRFTGDGKLAFMIQNPKKWEEKAVRFIDLHRWKLEKRALPFSFGHYAANINGFAKHATAFHTWPDRHLLGLVDDGDLLLYDTHSLTKIRKIPHTGAWLLRAHSHPWVLSLSGPLWDLTSGRRLATLSSPMKMGFASAAFSPEDRWVYARPYVGRAIRRYDTRSGRMIQDSGRYRTPVDIVRTTPDGRYILGAHATHDFVTYHGAVRRHRVDLILFDAETLRPVQRIESPPKSTFIDFRTAQGRIVASTYDTLEIYHEQGE